MGMGMRKGESLSRESSSRHTVHSSNCRCCMQVMQVLQQVRMPGRGVYRGGGGPGPSKGGGVKREKQPPRVGGV
jgi:hypothetical protein